MRVKSCLLLVCSLLTIGAECQISYSKLQRDVIEARLQRVPNENKDRKNELQIMFKEAGCEEGLAEQQVKGSKLPNVICTIVGEENAQIIVGAHFDKVHAGTGIVDNWSGASLLPSLVESLKGKKRKHTIIFIGFTDEEAGEVGSNFYVKQLSKEQVANIRAMVNMDTLGLGPSEVWVSHADKNLTIAIGEVARALSLPVTAMNVDGVGSTDSEQFRNKKIPAITIHSLTSATLPVLHSPKDTISAMKLDDYYQSYQLIAGYISYLDATLPK